MSTFTGTPKLTTALKMLRSDNMRDRYTGRSHSPLWPGWGSRCALLYRRQNGPPSSPVSQEGERKQEGDQSIRIINKDAVMTTTDKWKCSSLCSLNDALFFKTKKKRNTWIIIWPPEKYSCHDVTQKEPSDNYVSNPLSLSHYDQFTQISLIVCGFVDFNTHINR